MNRYQRRQLATTVVLLLLVIACVGTGLYLRGRGGVAHRVYRDPFRGKLSESVVEADKAQALARYRGDAAEEPAAILSQMEDSGEQKAALLFYGTCGQETGQALLQALRQADLQAALFLTASDAGENPDLVNGFIDAGFEVGVLNDGTGRSLASASATSVVENLALAGTTIQSYYGVQPKSILLLEQPDGELPYAAAAAFYEKIYSARKTVNPSQLTSLSAAGDLVAELDRGQLLAVKLSGGGSGAAQGLEYLVQAMGQADLSGQAENLLSQSGTGEAQTVRDIHTIRRAVCFTFSGMGSQKELSGVLDALANLNGRGIFYLTNEDITEFTEAAREIQEQGHMLGLLVSGTGTAEEILERMLAGKELLAQKLQVTGEIPVQSAVGAPGDAFLSAAEAGGFPVLSYDMLATRQEDIRQTDVDALLEKVLPERYGVLRRGQIVHFYLGFFQNSDTTLGQLVGKIGKERNIYQIIPATEILADTESLYTYPLPESAILPAVRDKIHPGQLENENISLLASRYIGTTWVDRSSYLPGFSSSEIRLLDKTGLVSNAGNRIFLTFDDWGTDENLTKLLDVLAKHNAKATFFVRTHAVEGNPNLLRAIAAEGHAIGSHTDTHFALSNDTGSGRKFTELTQEQCSDLAQDLVKSYETLQSVVGDMQVDGKPVLCRIFRPPTLAMSRSGLSTVLDCGFTWSVSGSLSTQDYQAKSAEEIFRKMKADTKDGAVFILHMSDNSIYTADAVDMYLTYLETDTRGYQVCRLSDVLDG